MACTISDETYLTIKQLIKQFTEKQENSQQFLNMEKIVVNQIKNSSSMYFSNKKQISDQIYSMCDKFLMHNFPSEAEMLKKHYHQYITDNLPYSELMNRLNVVKFLLCMSESPIEKFLRFPERFFAKNEAEVEEIDWKTYLLEDCEKYQMNVDESSTSSSDLESNQDEECDQKSDIDEDEVVDRQIELIHAEEAGKWHDLKDMKENLFFNVHQLWYNQINTIIEADSRWFEANVAVLWEQHLNEQIGGLIPLNNLIILPEYNVIREIFWQLYKPHNSIVFELNGNKLILKSNITVPSVRTIAFQSFVRKFVSYIELMEFFRNFMDLFDENDDGICETYRSYAKSLKSIITPVYNRVVELEKIVQKQETTFTLLQLYRHFDDIFEPIIVLKQIHNAIILDFKENSSVECACNLLARLFNGLNASFNKMEQDLKLTLFLDSVYYYFMVIDLWLMNDDFTDKHNEFVINKNFDIQENLSNFSKNNYLINIITEEILQIGKNINLLRSLGQYNLINDNNETIYEEFVGKCLIEINKFNTNSSNSNEECVIVPKNTSQTQELTKFVDDCLLLADFMENFQPERKIQHETLFERISTTTCTLIPIQLILERILNNILKDRFTVSNLMVKTVLIEQYKLDLEFQFLRHLYLFHDDVIFTFYIRFFEKMETGCKNWCNKIWLTNHLQDIMMDLYPDFYENCSVDIKDNHTICTDSLQSCNLINLQHNLQWPLNVIITEEQIHIYKSLFQFILKLKWALYTINRLNFSDVNPEKSHVKMCLKNYQNKLAVKKLIYLRFSLINLLNSVQHYVFGYIFAMNLLKFELDFEKSSDLVSIQRTHEEFICSINKQVKEIRDCGTEMNGCNAIFECVKNLNRLWNHKRFFSLSKVDECFQMYNKAYKDVNVVINYS